ncbi:helix-turn-helix transcriptional regulator [Streptomyces sp. NPDC032940]|uniref:helix-turn-helix domain-containing protein n=1 Tax=Streptomyces sp. NPDC032940 TaxID=3155366 RepID=UPI0033DB97E4
MTDLNIWDRHSWDVVRRSRGITYGDIADVVGVTYKAVSKWFYGERTPSLRSQILMAKALGIPLSKALESITDEDTRALIRYALEND